MWPRRGLMARISLLCTITGGRTPGFRAMAPLPPSWKSTTTGATKCFQMLGNRALKIKPREARGAATTAAPRPAGRAWRKVNHVRSSVVSAPEDMEQSQPQQYESEEQERQPLKQQHQQHQQRAHTTTTAGGEGEGRHDSRARDERLKTTRRAFKPDTKRMLIIPEEEWPSYPNFSFTVESECQEGTKARTGTLSTPHGIVKTPAFIFCATKAAIKGLSAETMKECGSQIILSNTYHLLVQPGGEMIEKMGGLQKATRWERPMLTDSGGYQIFSMGHGSVGDEIKGRRGAEGSTEFAPSLVSISEKGARFKSYFDCSIKSLTPERSVEIQRQLGADLVVVLDECTPFHVDKDYTKSSMHRTHRWAMRSLREFIDGDDGTQALYGIIQGGVYPDLRNEAVEFVNKAPFFGIAVGGSLGADKATMHQVVSQTMANVRRDRPVHLLGIGGIADIFHGVRQGIDTFDCVHPTRLGRHGGALVKASFWTREQELEEERANQEEAAAAAAAAAEEEASVDGDTMAAGVGASKRRRRRRRSGDVRSKRHPVVPREHVNLLKGRYREDHRVIDEDCGCPTCRGGYTRAYINHLGRAGELLGGMLVSQHNVFFMNELMTSIRTAIAEGRLAEEEDKWLAPGLRARDFHKRAAAAEAAAGEERGESHH